jgi:hypothetical protein
VVREVCNLGSVRSEDGMTKPKDAPNRMDLYEVKRLALAMKVQSLDHRIHALMVTYNWLYLAYLLNTLSKGREDLDGSGFSTDEDKPRDVAQPETTKFSQQENEISHKKR